MNTNPYAGCFGEDGYGETRGSVSFRVQKGQIVASIALRNAKPNTEYVVFQRCINGLDTYVTNGKGAANITVKYAPVEEYNSVDLRNAAGEHIVMGPFPLSL